MDLRSNFLDGIPGTVTDFGNGSYAANYFATIAGTYSVHILMRSGDACVGSTCAPVIYATELADSPFKLTVGAAAPTSPNHTLVHGVGVG